MYLDVAVARFFFLRNTIAFVSSLRKVTDYSLSCVSSSASLSIELRSQGEGDLYVGGELLTPQMMKPKVPKNPGHPPQVSFKSSAFFSI
jgi:hypothetical protein